MKKIFLTLFLFILTAINAQIRFENGYLIKNNGEKISCLIKNVDWAANPNTFSYKLNNESETIEGKINDIKEFGLIDGAKFVRATVDIDRSSDVTDYLTTKPEPDFVRETLYLKKLVDSDISLYSYRNNNYTRYFYSKPNSDEIKQLVYKKYLIDNDKVLAQASNDQYISQLKEIFKDRNISDRIWSNISYTEKSLKEIFTSSLEKNQDVKVDITDNKTKFHIKPKIGASFGSLTTTTGGNLPNIDFGSKTGLVFGAEVEVILPFNKNKWGIIFDPYYQSYKSEKSHTYNLNTVNTITVDAVADYKSIVLPLGLRYYMFLDDNSKLFVNYLYNFEAPLSSRIYYSNRPDLLDLEVKPKQFSSLGAGYQFNKLTAEFRYNFPHDITSSYINYKSTFNNFIVTLSYTIL